MHKVRKILVPIDFSPESGRALRNAAVLAREAKAQLIALHVIDEKTERKILLSSVAPVAGLPFPLENAAPIPVDVMLRERALDLWNFVAHQAGLMNQDRIRKVVRIGKLAGEISAFMSSEDVDLLVLELRQQRLFPDFATLRLLAIAGRLSCPVLVDPPATRERSEPRNGLHAFDLLAQFKILANRHTPRPTPQSPRAIFLASLI